MYGRKCVGPTTKPWGTPALTAYSCEDFLSRTNWSCLLLRKEEMRPNSIGLKFVKKASMSNPVKSLEYIKCYSLSSPRIVKSPSNSIRYNCQKISSWSRRPKTKLEIKKGHISLDDQQSHCLQEFNSSENTVMHCYLALNTLKIQGRTRLTFLHSKRLLNFIAQKYTTFDLQGSHIKSKRSACF